MFPIDILRWPGGTREKSLEKSEVRLCASEQGSQCSYLRYIGHIFDTLQAFERKENGFAKTEIAVVTAFWQQKRLQRFLEPSHKAMKVCSKRGFLAQVQSDWYRLDRSPDSFITSCSWLQELNKEKLLLESTCRHWGYTGAPEEPAEYLAGATEEQKQVQIMQLQTHGTLSSPTQPVVQSDILMFGSQECCHRLWLSTFAGFHAEPPKICHSCSTALVEGPRPHTRSRAHAEGFGNPAVESAGCPPRGNHNLRLSFCQ